ncbi:MAG: hypothetical protein HYT50_02635 [Candidatus Wildermuthbacteria bacterium]|nr:hypothetical protein [Candidatus Wildermuthbacteria bacterium]
MLRFFTSISIIGSIFFFAGVPLLARAQSSGLSISPLTFEMSARQGEMLSNMIKVTNIGSAPLQVYMETRNFSPVGEEGQIALREDQGQGTLASWIRISPETFTLRPGQKQEVQFSVSVPAGAAFGGHYASLLASFAGTQTQGGSRVAQKVGSLLLLQVAGQAQEQLSVASFEGPGFSEYGPLAFSFRFENTGNVHLKPRGYLEVKNMLGKEVAKIQLPQKNVLPNSVRKVEVSWDDRFLFGKYQANLAAVYGADNQMLSQALTFWVIPWKLVTVGVLGALLLAAFLYVVRKRILTAIRVLILGEKRAP